jgi:hypothetical protein
MQSRFGSKRCRLPALVLDRPYPVACGEEKEDQSDRDPSPMPVDESVFGFRLWLAGARIGRGDRSGDGTQKRQQRDEAVDPHSRAREAVARVLDTGTDPTDREQDAEAECDPPERATRREQRGDGGSGNRW